MDPKIVSLVEDGCQDALSENGNLVHGPTLISSIKEVNSFHIQPSDAVKFLPETECNTPGESDSDYQDDPIVIIGMGKNFLAFSCRLPGGISSPRDLWNMLIQKKSGQCEVPKSRFNIAGFYHPEGARAGVMNTAGGYFLQEDVRQFDNSFFGINNLEATYMDPQQRKLLEVVYECFESSGSSLEKIAGSNVGVYVGNFTVDFQTMQARDSEYLHRYSATGSGTAILANRVSHVFDLRGPSFTLDTACSSSIYCLHNAVTALEREECDAAIVAGANLITAPEQHLGTMKGGVLSATSTCHTFDGSADGYGRAEGISALYLKRLSTAVKDGDPIRAVVRATAINSNGKTPGITQPGINGQEAVIRKTYKKAGLDWRDTSYVECHGTGTPVGDPIEVEGLSRVFSQDIRPPLLIGAVKTNLGHSEAASGISSVIKAVLAFEHGKIPATIGITNLNPKIPFEKYNMKVVTEVMEWPTALHRASINSFGYGGANSHAILESIDSVLPGYRQKSSKPEKDLVKDYILPFSASSLPSLHSRVLDISERLQGGEKYHFDDLCYTLANRRSYLNTKGFLLASEAAASDGFATDKLIVQKESSPCLPLGFVFTGQGAQWPQMGKELLEKNHKFLTTLRRLDGILKELPEHPSWTLEESILEPAATSKVSEVAHSQTLCTAIQIGLVDLLRSWKIEPAVVVGHSSGEIAAAYAAGLLSAAQAIVAAYYRGYAVSRATLKGTMLAAGINNEDAEKIIKDKSLERQVTVACVNSPESVTLSGDSQGIDEILTELQSNKKFARKLHTGNKAYHSHMMKEIGTEYERLLSTGLRGQAGEFLHSEHPVKMFSSVGQSHESLDCFSRGSRSHLAPSYWRRNLENPVQFHTALKNICATGKYHLLEIGPHSALQLPIKQTRVSLGIQEDDLPYHATLSRGKNSDTCLKMLAGHLYLHGHELDFLNVNTIDVSTQGESGRVLHDLPPYRWNYGQTLWSEPRSSSEFRNRQYVRHELLGSTVVAGNGIEHGWRNILKLKEIPWLEDHKLESSIVFPAAGYLAMAIEAISQIKNLRDSPSALPSFTFRNVNIQSALVVRQEDNETELFTSIRAEQISTASTSNLWFNFTISSHHNGAPTQHCIGTIGLSLSSSNIPGIVRVDAQDYEKWKMGRWYEKLAVEGLCFGPAFQSLTSMKTDGARLKPEALSTTTLIQRTKMANTSTYPGTFYVAHPLVIDSCLQAAIMGGTAGNLDTLKAYMPVFISHCQINQTASEQVGLEASIHSKSQSTGFGTKKIHVTLRDASDKTIIDISNARLALYKGKTENVDPATYERHPCLRVVWKPDILRIDEACQPQLEAYLQQFIKTRPDLADNHSVGVIAGLLDLVGHKNPRLRALELGSDCDCKSRQWLGLLDTKTAFSRYRDYQVGNFTEDGQLLISHAHNLAKSEKYALDTDTPGAYDVLVVPSKASTSEYWERRTGSILKLLNQQGILIGRSSEVGETALKKNGYTVIRLSGDVMFARAPQKSRSYKGKTVILLVVSKGPSLLIQSLKDLFSKIAEISSIKEYTLSELEAAEIPQRSIVISCLEIKKAFLPVMSPKEMDLLRRVTDKTADLLWLTGAAMLEGRNPDLTLASGLSRALMLEQPALRFAILDMDISADDVSSNDHTQVHRFVKQALLDSDIPDDKEFVQRNGLLHVSRFVPDNGLNSHFSQRRHQIPVATTLEEASPARLAIGKVGLMDTIYFQQESEPKSSPPAGFVDIDVKAVSLNAKDIYVLSGKVETRAGTSAIEFSGVIKAIGPDVNELLPGDRVVVLAPNSFRTTERVPAWGCLKMLPEEDFETMPTLPVIYGTALYALNDRASLRAGETILIHSGAGAFGMASIEIAQKIGATVYTTVSTDEKKDFLVSRYGLPRENIFQSRDTTFVDGIQAATAGKGVDVVLNSLTGDLLHASWMCCANFGRFIEVGKRDIVDAGKLDMQIFSRNVTFSAFDLTELYYHENQYYRDIWINKFKEAVALFRAKKIRPVPIKVFDISEITQAYRYFSGKNRTGKVVVSLLNQKSVIRAVKSKYSATFDPEKSYVLIGCLGGLGRSLSNWMFTRGARNFTFLGRSATDKENARELVQSLEKSGASVKVVRGDVVNQDDVIKTVSACELPIGGVVQAAMGLHEALFTSMTHKAWHTGIQPKWQGTWNIHHALEGKDDHLDFFLLTSSVSGSVGTATESNYCSANGFLDAFARHRRSLGKPICSLGLGMISEVGYLHENPEIEALLLRKGIQPLNQDEFLQVVDLSLAGKPVANGLEYDSLAHSHILTGLEPHGIRKLLQQGFDVNNGTMQDSRAILLSASLDSKDEENESNTISAAATAAWSVGLPPDLIKALASEASSARTLGEAILNLIRKRFSNLILMPLDKVNDSKPLSQYGMDSMIAAEYRTWFWSTFKVDIPFLEILSSTNCLKTLGELVEEKVEESLKQT